MSEPAPSPTFRVLGVRINALQIPDVVRQIERWIALDVHGRYICASNVHSLIESRRRPSFKNVLNSADLTVPDGMPLIWLGRLWGHILKRRVYGPDLVLEFCRSTTTKDYKHFFYGGSPGVVAGLAKELKNRFPTINIAGSYSPPFRPLSPEEDASEVSMINCAAPDVLWVGLGCPKQEVWMYEHRERLSARVMVGVGQAFAIHAGQAQQAPVWLREHGLEWLFRLLIEPGRLWKRYLVYSPQFLCLLFLEALRLKKFD
jgi:N-acetylglucosaminyldiphosphoundecaprenol N-acetyl-beta-D-mannosaminyltransferase